MGSNPLSGCNAIIKRRCRFERKGTWLPFPWVIDLTCAGGVGERLIPPDCKSGARKGFVGSNPTPSTREKDTKETSKRPHSSEVEHVLGKNGVTGSTPVVGSM